MYVRQGMILHVLHVVSYPVIHTNMYIICMTGYDTTCKYIYV